LDTDLTGLAQLLGDVFELMSRQGQLQPANGKQREPKGAPSLFCIRQVIVFSQH